MSVLYIVFPLALLIVAIAVGAYIWATRSGQLDDLETPALRMLHDDSDAGRGPRQEGGSPAKPTTAEGRSKGAGD